MAVEVGRSGRESIDDDSASSEFVATSHAAHECIDEQVPAKRSSLLGAVEGEAGK